MHAFSKTLVLEVVQKHCKYTISDMLCCQSVANSGVFATLAFLIVVVNTNALARFWGSEGQNTS